VILGSKVHKVRLCTATTLLELNVKDGRKVDIVPILDAGDGSGDGDLIRKDTGARVRTNIPRQLEFIRTRKARLPVHYRQVIRLLKWWAEQLKREDDSVRFKSYLSELVCAHLLDRGVVFTSYPDALASIFSYIKTSGLTEPIIFADYYERATVPRAAHGIMTVIDPVNPSNNIVSDYTERNRQTIVTAASRALDAIDFAEYAATTGEAVTAWAEVLGPQFRGR
jgi:hypothetical protein